MQLTISMELNIFLNINFYCNCEDKFLLSWGIQYQEETSVSNGLTLELNYPFSLHWTYFEPTLNLP